MSEWTESNVAVAERDDDITIKADIERELEAEARDGRDDADCEMFSDGAQTYGT